VRTRSSARSSPPEAPPAAPETPALERLELRVERLRTSYRFTWAFHAREVRFERNAGEGWQRAFPETFSFSLVRHDPAELYLQLEDLWSKPQVASPIASRRDSETIVTRLCSAVPRYLERTLDRLEREAGLEGDRRLRIYEDVLLLSRIFGRFLADKKLVERPDLLTAAQHLRKLSLRALQTLIALRVRPESVLRYLAGELPLVDPTWDDSDTAVLAVLGQGDPDPADRMLLRLGEAAYHEWLEEICLDEGLDAFAREGSPFADRETEVMAAASSDGHAHRLERGRDLSLFLRRRQSRDCARLLDKLQRFFLRQYDVHHAAVMIHHATRMERGSDDADRVLSRHSARNYLLALALISIPLVGGMFAYERAPLVFDVWFSLEMLACTAGAFWFLGYRFVWKRDLSSFRASAPRLAAGIIVGYLPVFLIDEVWDLALRSSVPLLASTALFGLTTLLYLYVEVQRRLGNPDRAFERTRRLFLLAVLQALVVGLIASSLVGRFMVLRAAVDIEGNPVPFEVVRAMLPQMAGQLPRIVGVDPFFVFPTVVLLMTFLSIFIGTFLQLLWEDLPITEPL
jgi:hypothetical protein